MAHMFINPIKYKLSTVMGTINRTYIHNTITKYSYWSCVHLAVNQGPPHDSCWGVGQRSVAAASESNGSLDVVVGHWHPVHHWAARSLQQAPGLRLEPRKTNMKMRGSCFFSCFSICACKYTYINIIYIVTTLIMIIILMMIIYDIYVYVYVYIYTHLICMYFNTGTHTQTLEHT